jgi:hypothetical protein
VWSKVLAALASANIASVIATPLLAMSNLIKLIVFKSFWFIVLLFVVFPLLCTALWAIRESLTRSSLFNTAKIVKIS